MVPIASRTPELGLGMAVRGEKVFTGTASSQPELFLKKSLQVDATKPETITEALKVGAKTGLSSSRIKELDTRNNVMGSGEVDPATGTKTRVGEELTQKTNADNGKIRVKTLADYFDPTTPSAAKDDLQDRVIAVVNARPYGSTVKMTRNKADQFIKDNYKRLSTFSDREIQQIIDDPSQNPIATAEAVLNTKLARNDAEFAKTIAQEAKTDAKKRHTDLKKELTELNNTTVGKGLRLETLKLSESTRQATIATEEAAIRGIEAQRANDMQALLDLQSRYGTKTPVRTGYNTYTVVDSDTEIKAQMTVIQTRLNKYNNPANPDSLPAHITKLTQNQIDQKEYESLLTRKGELPNEITQANQDVLQHTNDLTNAEEKVKKAKEAEYYANQSRATTELKYSESVAGIFDKAINTIIDENIDAVVPNLAKALDMEAQLRVAKMEERLTKLRQEKIVVFDKSAGIRHAWLGEKWVPNKKLMKKDMDDLVTMTDPQFDTFITGNNLIDDYGKIPPVFSDEQKAQMRALVATRIVDTNFKYNNKIPDNMQLFELSKKGWVDQLHVMNLKNNPDYVAKLQQEFPGEEISEDNAVLTSKVHKNIVMDGALLLLMFGLTSASTMGKENK